MDRAPSFSFPTCVNPSTGVRGIHEAPLALPLTCSYLGLPFQGPAACEHLAQAVPIQRPHGFEGLHKAVNDGF
jgi:hypothetical protein